MTLEDYIKNPMGIGSSVVSNRQLYDQLYRGKWDSIKVRENGLIEYKKYKAGDNYYIHFKIPSETIPKFYYDVVIRFFKPKEKVSGAIEKSLAEYDFQVYSNDPSFVFTFAHAFKKNKLFIPDLEYKMSKMALEQKPVEKNPKDQLGYVKSIYFAYLEIKSQNLLMKNKWEHSIVYNKNVWNNTITHADDKVRERIELGNAASKKEKRENNTTKNEQKDGYKHSQVNTSPNIRNYAHYNSDHVGKTSIGRFVKSINPFVKHKKR